MSSSSVCGDLLGRLEAKLPQGSPLLKKQDPEVKKNNDKFMQELKDPKNSVISQMENNPGTKKVVVLESQDFPIEEISSTSTAPEIKPPAEKEPVMGESSNEEKRLPGAQLAYEGLKKIVDRFNEDLSKWYEESGCVANFNWKYGKGKVIDIVSIDYIVYRKEAPSPQSVKDILDKYAP